MALGPFVLRIVTAGPFAPADWRLHGFPLNAAGHEEVRIDCLAVEAAYILDDAKQRNDRTHLGRVLHWAHLLTIEQSADGSWPMQINARTGKPVGIRRTMYPAILMQKLDELLNSTEFERCIARAFPDDAP